MTTAINSAAGKSRGDLIFVIPLDEGRSEGLSAIIHADGAADEATPSAPNDLPDGVDDRVRPHSVVLDQLLGRTRLTKAVMDADELDRYRMTRGETFGDGGAHAAIDLVLFDRHESPRLSRERDDRIDIQRL